MSRACLILLAAGVIFPALAAQARTFTNRDGKTLEAEVLAVEAGQVKLKRDDGREFSIPVASLSDGDQAYLKAWKPENDGATDAPMKEAVPSAAEDPDLKPGGTFKLDFPDLTVDRKDAPASCQVRLPASYAPGKPLSLVIWLAGGDGGNSPNTSFLPEGDFVAAGLPYPKGANNPGQANMVGDYEAVWDYHRVMIEAILKKVPGIDKSRSLIGGFSNGAHAIDGMLRLRSKKGEGVADYFGVFLLSDGGGSYSASKGNYPSLKGRHAYICWGETSPNANPSKAVAKDFRSRGAEEVASEMKDVGHAFPESEQAKVRDWLEKVVIPSWTSGSAPKG